MDPRLEATRGAGLQDSRGLAGREHARFAKDVAPLGEILGGDRRDHIVDDEADVVFPPVAVIERDLVRAHEGGHEINRLIGRQPLDRAQHLQFGVEVETVAALDLGGRRAAGEHLGKPRPRRGDQLRLRSLPGRADGRQDAAALRGDLGVSGAAEPAPQLLAAIAREHGVRVTVDEAGDGRQCPPIHNPDVGGRRQRRRQAVVRAGIQDALTL
jgi:hypothetical protein